MKKRSYSQNRWMKAALCAVTFIIGTMMLLSASAAETVIENNKVECEGFDTPEEAVTAFCEALKENDIQKAVSTFAIESYCENYDYAGYLNRIRALLPVTQSGYGLIEPSENELLSRLNIELRAGEIARRIYNPLFMITLDNMSLSEDEKIREIAEDLREMKTVSLEDFISCSDLSYLTEQLQQFPDFSSMEITKPISPIAFGIISSNYLSEVNLSNIMINALINGASGVTELGVIMEDDTNIYFVTMNVVKYKDKWYNCAFGGNIMAIMGIEAARQGIIGAPKEAVGEGIKNLLVFDSADDQSLLKKEMLPEFEDFKENFEQQHLQYNETIKSKAEENGLVYDPDIPWLEQLDVLKELADKNGERFFSRDYVSVYAMPYEEMLAFFSEEELAAE